jgi:hypothetical protein
MDLSQRFFLVGFQGCFRRKLEHEENADYDRKVIKNLALKSTEQVEF